MSAYIAFVIQGKSHPLYKSYQVDYRDKCIIVNGKYVKLTGKKLDTKLYRHHTSIEINLISLSGWIEVHSSKELSGEKLSRNGKI